ncbi:HAMP domain-containing histidine kinase [Oxalobacteraceae bacterium OM1]|nr:HAMP domain-containing histidine kinase [Oxalobacteraceae bacterium OM1]
MVMMVSHDLKTPLNVAAMSFEFLHRLEGKGEPATQRMVERGLRATATMEKLITNILDVAKIEAGTLVLDVKPESGTEIATHVLDEVSLAAKTKNIRLLPLAADCGTCMVLCERARIYQVLSNLVSNALKFTKPGGEIRVTMESKGVDVVFCVADTGEGIPSEDLPRIFERFWQAEETSSMGTGLGLWIAKGIVQRHGGRIWVESELALGTRFFFCLPGAG